MIDSQDVAQMVQRSPVYPPSLSPPVKTYIIMVQNQNQEIGLGTLCVYSFLPGCYRCGCLKALLPSRCRMLHHCKGFLLFPLTVAPSLPPTTNLFSMSVLWLFWRCYVNWIIQYVVFWDCILFSFSRIPLRPVQAVSTICSFFIAK